MAQFGGPGKMYISGYMYQGGATPWAHVRHWTTASLIKAQSAGPGTYIAELPEPAAAYALLASGKRHLEVDFGCMIASIIDRTIDAEFTVPYDLALRLVGEGWVNETRHSDYDIEDVRIFDGVVPAPFELAP